MNSSDQFLVKFSKKSLSNSGIKELKEFHEIFREELAEGLRQKYLKLFLEEFVEKKRKSLKQMPGEMLRDNFGDIPEIVPVEILERIPEEIPETIPGSINEQCSSERIQEHSPANEVRVDFFWKKNH